MNQHGLTGSPAQTKHVSLESSSRRWKVNNLHLKFSRKKMIMERGKSSQERLILGGDITHHALILQIKKAEGRIPTSAFFIAMSNDRMGTFQRNVNTIFSWTKLITLVAAPVHSRHGNPCS